MSNSVLSASDSLLSATTSLEIPKLYNEHQVAELLGVSVKTIRRWRLLDQGPPYKKINHAVRYPVDQVLAWFHSCPIGGERMAQVS